jgi:hypothetical protein
MKRTFLQNGLVVFVILSCAAIGLSQKTANEYVALGNQQYKQKEYDNAIRSQTECIRLYQREKECRITRGLAYKE